MPTAKVITDGDTQILVLPKDVRFNCDEVEIKENDAGMYFTPIDSSQYTYLPNDVIMEISDRLIEKNIEAYKELAK